MGKCPVTGHGKSVEGDDAYVVNIDEDAKKATTKDVIDLMRPFYWPGESGDSTHKVFILRMFVILAIVALFCGKACNLLAPYYMGQVITALGENSKMLALRHLLVMAVLFLGGTTFDETRNLLFSYVQCHGLTTLALKFYSHLHTMDYQWFVDTKSGQMIRCMTRGLESMRELTRFGVLLMVPTMLEAFSVCVLFAVYFREVWLVVTLVVGLSLYIGVTIVATNWRNKTRAAEAQRDDEMHNVANDGMNNFETVKYYTNEAHEVAQYTSVVRKHQKCQWRVLSSLSILNMSQELMKQTTIGLCLLFGVLAAASGSMKVGDVVSIQTYLFYLYRPLFMLGTMYAMICRAMAGIQSAANMMQCKPAIVDREDAVSLELDVTTSSDLPMIEFQDVSFSFPERGGRRPKVILRNLSFTVPKGHSLAIVGATGAGKTTVSLLLCRLYDSSSGRIMVNGMDITAVTQESLRRNIGVVSQNTALFHATLRDNIRYAKLDATDEEVYEALRRASFLDRVMAMPDRLDTVVGEKGMRLSGGEKQRVSIARCFLKDPPIIVLDEATSALDSKTEADIQSTLRLLFHNRTVLTIAHRLSTIVDCDCIMYMENGEVKEFGSHSELLQRGGGYKSLWDAQSGGKMTALHNLVQSDNQSGLERVLEGALRIRRRDDPSATVLLPEFVDKRDSHGRTALHLAAHKGRSSVGVTHETGRIACVRLLLRYGASAQATARDSTTALHFAAQNGHEEIARELHLALSKGHAGVAAELVGRGAVQKYNAKAKLPFDLATKRTLFRLQELLGNQRFERLRDKVSGAPKVVKTRVAFYHRKKKPKKPSSEAKTDPKPDTSADVQDKANPA
ncbi:ABC transporter family protein [Babesia ovata]|uniref:ABC transporter family protein n=1 Tax=Babesia ovata TaxID=189622 RepID=A0A2H6KDL8_9APIC|nr:ABC transporter family protein [Babesia ovata]GBE61085.1 ABC transporter family protein [Babesia ovata]